MRLSGVLRDVVLVVAGALMVSGETLATPEESARPRIEITREKTAETIKRAITHHPVVNGWKKASSRNFHLIHDLEHAVAETLLQYCEEVRGRVQKKWMPSDDAEQEWPAKCSIYLYPTAEQYTAETSVPRENRGHSKVGKPEAGRVGFREISMYGEPPQLFHSVIDHEIAHTTTAGILQNNVWSPKWLDEGIAVLSEQKERPMLSRPLMAIQEETLLSLRELFTMKGYPKQRERHWPFYVQAAMVTEFLRAQHKDPSVLGKFARDGENEKIGYNKAAEKYFGKTIEQLETEWRRAYVRATEVLPASRR